ncbi:TOMM precursor leader peptide-binding protein [Streptomyces anulatus]|uniref:TOMM precursor leader peptide-binding protein n=1 Tax=Streptomyces anulatus TaxID=1892 RepID=UPI002F9107B2
MSQEALHRKGSLLPTVRCRAYDVFGREVADRVATLLHHAVGSVHGDSDPSPERKTLSVELSAAPSQVYDDHEPQGTSTLVLPVSSQPRSLLVGPLRTSGRPCTSCMVLRNDQHQWGLEQFFSHGGFRDRAAPASRAGAGPAIVSAAAALVLLMALRAGDGDAEGLAWYLDLPQHNPRSLHIVPMPHCPRCSAPDARSNRTFR